MPSLPWQYNLSLIWVGAVQYDRAANYLDDMDVLQPGRKGMACVLRGVGCCFQYLQLKQFTRVEGIACRLDRSRRYAFFADVQDRLERMGERPQVGALLRGECLDGRVSVR